MIKRSRPKPYSDKQIARLQADVEVKRRLIRRCSGIAVDCRWHKGKLINVMCAGGRCELCGMPPAWLPLSNHEIVFKSAGGQVSMDNSIMLCSQDHWDAHNHLISQEELYKRLEEINK